MEFAIVKNNVVLTRIVADEETASALAKSMGGTLESDQKAQVGFKKQGGKWVDTRPSKESNNRSVNIEKLASLLATKGVITSQELEGVKD